MSRARSNSLSALSSVATSSRDPQLAPLEIHAATDVNFRQRPERPGAASPSNHVSREASPPSQHRPLHHARETNLSSSIGWKGKNLLACDGGGIRGYASVIMIEALMIHIGQIERNHPEAHQNSFAPHPKPKMDRTGATGYDKHDDGSYISDYLPCHYFDYMVGTSTGGLIAVMLSRWRMSVGECLRQYQTVGRTVFQHPRKFGLMGILHDKYHKAPLVEVISNLTDDKTPPEIQDSGAKFQMFSSPPDLCRTAVFAKEETRNGSTKGPYIFRSYEAKIEDNVPQLGRPRNYGSSIDHEILKVCRATTAAPTFFRPQRIGDNNYSDGALGYNNPTLEAFDEMHMLHGNCFKNVVSFGTGKPGKHSERTESTRKKLKLVKAINKLNDLFKTAKAGLTDCETTHEIVEGIARRSEGAFQYYRFNIEEGLGKIKIDECKPTTLATLEECAKAELKKPEIQRNLRALAHDLVNQRRERIRRYPSQWERYVCCTSYVCDAEMCRNDIGGPITVFYRDEMSAHLQDRHPSTATSPEMTRTKLDSLRRQPEFPVGPW